VETVLGEDAPLFMAYFSVTEQGNFEDPHHPEFGRRNVLSTPRPAEEVAADLSIAPAEFEAKLVEMREKMLAARELRVKPGLDDKMLASWNGLALAAYAEAARVMGDAHYRDIAEKNATFLREKLWGGERLLHSYKGGTAKVGGMLEDYAYVGLGLVELYRATGELEHLEWAKQLFAVILERFHDDDAGGFFETPADGEELILRQKSFFDAATPSGNGAVALLGLWLGRYYVREDWERVAAEVIAQVADHLLQAVTGFGTILQALEFLMSPPRGCHRWACGRAGATQREAAQLHAVGHAAPTADTTDSHASRSRPPPDGRTLACLCENRITTCPASAQGWRGS
jgi:uncharacterized protein YyaL (SSP411 family)